MKLHTHFGYQVDVYLLDNDPAAEDLATAPSVKYRTPNPSIKFVFRDKGPLHSFRGRENSYLFSSSPFQTKTSHYLSFPTKYYF